MNRYRSLKSQSKHWWGAIASALFAVAAYADDTDWQLHGALTQGVIYTSNNNFYGHSDDNASLKFTEINFNASARLLPNLRAAGQALYRQAGAQGESGGVDYAFLDYQFLTESAYTMGVRAGRYKLPIGLYNETRDIAFARPSIYLPQSAYPDRARDLELSGDGALLYTDIFSNAGQWTLELDAGHPRVDKHTVQTAFNFIPGEIDHLGKSDSYGGRLMYQSSDSMWLAAFSRVQAKLRYTQILPSDVADQIAVLSPASGISSSSPDINIDVDFVYWIASLQCNINQWTFTGEYGHMDIQLESSGVGLGLHPLQYYVQAARHLDKHWTIYSRYDNLYWDRRDPSGDNYAMLAQTQNFANFAHDYGFGARYDINSNAMVSAEYHYIDGTAWSTGLNDMNATARYWNMVAIEFSYRF